MRRKFAGPGSARRSPNRARPRAWERPWPPARYWTSSRPRSWAVVRMQADERSRPTGQQGDSQEQQGQDTPYTYAWAAYVAAGWAGPIPIARTWKGKPTD